MRKIILHHQFSLFLCILALTGCSESSVEPEKPASYEVENKIAEESLKDMENFVTSRFFTGRDSFGIAFKAKVSGTFRSLEEGEWNKMTQEGNGKAAHLAHVHVVRNHYITEDLKIKEGEFKYTGFKGDMIFGTYEGTRSPTGSDGSFTFEVEEEIKGGTGRFAGVVEKVTTTGIYYPNGMFTYVSDGWMSNTHANRQRE